MCLLHLARSSMPTDFVSGTATTRANGFAFLGVRPTTAPADRPVAPAVTPRFSFLGAKPSQFPQARTIQGAHSEARLAQPYLVARAPLVPVHGNILPGRPTFITKPLAAPSSRVVLPKRIYEPSPSACASSGPTFVAPAQHVDKKVKGPGGPPLVRTDDPGGSEGGPVPAVFLDGPAVGLEAPAGQQQELQKVPHPGAGSTKAIADAHRKPKRRLPEFKTDKERAAFLVESEIATILPLLPAPVVRAMLGGELGWRQVREPAARLAQVRRTLAKRAGAEGDRVAGVRTMLSHVRKYAATAFPELTPAERDDACFPMSAPWPKSGTPPPVPASTSSPARSSRSAPTAKWKRAGASTAVVGARVGPAPSGRSSSRTAWRLTCRSPRSCATRR